MASQHSLVTQYRQTEEITSVQSEEGTQEADERRGDDRVSISGKALKHLARDMEKLLHGLDGEHKKEGHGRNDLGHIMKKLEKDLAGVMKHMGGNSPAGAGRISVGEHEASGIGFVKNILETLTGRDMKMSDMEGWSRHVEEDESDDDDGDGHKMRPGAQAVMYSMHEQYHESEQTSFNAGGTVNTADGRSINFSLDLQMSREFMSERNISIAADGMDAANLLVDFAGPSSALSDGAFAFAPAAAGDSAMSFLSAGSGILTIDSNGNGIIDDAGEIIGSASGDAFSDLSVFDDDGNGWIDEADSVFSSIKVWSQGQDGSPVLSGLKESGIGAVNLGSVDTAFSLTDSNNNVTGQIDRSGVYLNEDGTPGVLQQLSITV